MNNGSIGQVLTVVGVTVALIAWIGMIPMIDAVVSSEPLRLDGGRLRILGTFCGGVGLYLLGRLVECQAPLTEN